MTKIYAISITCHIKEIIGKFKNLKVHSRFQSGINLIGENGLIFLGSRKNGELPFGIHFEDKDIYRLLENDGIEDFLYNIEGDSLISDNIGIDLSRAKFFNSQLKKISEISIKTSVKYLRDNSSLDLLTGFDMNIEELVSPKNELINDIRKLLKTNDTKNIEDRLRMLIGKGKGLTPSGDDFLIGLLWVNRFTNILGVEFYRILKDLILYENLTTDISINYYIRAFEGYFSSTLINLYNSLLESNRDMIDNSVLDLIRCGHTSGIDTLAGIIFGLKAVEEE